MTAVFNKQTNKQLQLIKDEVRSAIAGQEDDQVTTI